MDVELDKLVAALITASAALAGVWLGGWLTTQREDKRESDRRRRESAYVATVMSTHLDRFAASCLETAGDDGTVDGHGAGQDWVEHVATTLAPKFDPHAATGLDWKSLQPDLLDRLFMLPIQIAQLERELVNIEVVDWDPPDHLPYFFHRQVGYAKLGLAAIRLMRDLRNAAGLSKDFTVDVLTRHERHLDEVIADIESRQRRLDEIRLRSSGSACGA